MKNKACDLRQHLICEYSLNVAIQLLDFGYEFYLGITQQIQSYFLNLCQQELVISRWSITNFNYTSSTSLNYCPILRIVWELIEYYNDIWRICLRDITAQWSNGYQFINRCRVTINTIVGSTFFTCVTNTISVAVCFSNIKANVTKNVICFLFMYMYKARLTAFTVCLMVQ